MNEMSIALQAHDYITSTWRYRFRLRWWRSLSIQQCAQLTVRLYIGWSQEQVVASEFGSLLLSILGSVLLNLLIKVIVELIIEHLIGR